eukprot:8455688-Ditylum_brightwellii.AAC.1
MAGLLRACGELQGNERSWVTQSLGMWINVCMLYHGENRDGERFVISMDDGVIKGCKPVSVVGRSEK